MNILLIKLGALGDVLRTTPLLTGLRQKYGVCRITWFVDKRHGEVLRGNRLIDKLIFYEPSLSELKGKSFDLAVNLDKDEEALDAMAAARAKKKMGFARDASGSLAAADLLSEYALRLGFDDELKFRANRKTYQEISFEQVGLSFQGEEYLFELDEESRLFSRKHLKNLGVDAASGARVVGLNTGSGNRFAGKKLPIASYAELAEKFREMGVAVLLLGGEDERARNAEIKRLSPFAVDTGNHSIRRFAAIVGACDVVVSGDTTAMHIAIAMKVPVVATFASTCAVEIELYGRGRKIVSDIACAPCYKRICPIDEQCMKEMDLDKIVRAVRDCLKNSPK